MEFIPGCLYLLWVCCVNHVSVRVEGMSEFQLVLMLFYCLFGVYSSIYFAGAVFFFRVYFCLPACLLLFLSFALSYGIQKVLIVYHL